jgi:beta-lactamase regulating signal transducer with metallopeptidase domain
MNIQQLKSIQAMREYVSKLEVKDDDPNKKYQVGLLVTVELVMCLATLEAVENVIAKRSNVSDDLITTRKVARESLRQAKVNFELAIDVITYWGDSP